MYDTYIFDLYGTLIDIATDEEDPVIWDRLALHFRYAGMNAEGEALKAAVLAASRKQLEAGKTRFEYPEFVMEEAFGEVAAELGGSPSAAWLHETVRWFRTLSMRKLALYDGAAELLGTLRAAGKRLYLLSNGQRTFIEAELAVLGIRELFDGIAISSQAGVSKPDPLFYRYLEETFGANLSAALMIGNDPRTDLEGASRVGIDACYIHSESSPANIPVSCKHQIWDGDLRRIAGFSAT